ncbi:tRNA (adenosine(37)-N6)-threonylcarbamoyltransferase complex ATPase subunit type 1 TsaE [Sunxiuqinia dokdonensis]|uniref:tRNA threonylcarbamoyladenosine biosynthesis protein TsaE n=1 Tax=Sunxiuqinia dokdonensis TaxID=1409788 RepID=A0A0L8VAS5_9BACT|nr:tRNA (adenosine(37)-N6)-threonylcarbamoyltransferase complex ATPase subunit type 1 TsaE [Sunxiuqinia dokdonensis]KOH45282.1 ATP/GTP hydrolase [Sunxiuqinia dokdonensis]
MFSIQINTIEELPQAAEAFLRHFQNERIFAFYGKMGAGKTTLIKALCRALGSTDPITSPTFALVNEYSTAGNERIFHFDFYRIKNIEEALDIGFDDYVYSGKYCMMEWPENIEDLLPEKIVKVEIEVLDSSARRITANIV